MMLPKSLSKTHHEFCMETGNEFSRIHTCGKNGSAGIKEKTSHKPCTLCFKLSSSTFGKCHSPLKCFQFSSDLVTMWLRNTRIFLTTCQCTLPGKNSLSLFTPHQEHTNITLLHRDRAILLQQKKFSILPWFFGFFTLKKTKKNKSPHGLIFRIAGRCSATKKRHDV